MRYKNDVESVISMLAGCQCEHCGRKPVKGVFYYLDGDRGNHRWRNMVYVCKGCQLHIRAVWKLGAPLPYEWDKPPQWLLERGLPFKKRDKALA